MVGSETVKKLIQLLVMNVNLSLQPIYVIYSATPKYGFGIPFRKKGLQTSRLLDLRYARVADQRPLPHLFLKL